MSGHQLRVMIRCGRRPGPEGAAGRLGSPGAAVAGHPHPFNDVDVFGGPFGTGHQPRHMRAKITVGPDRGAVTLDQQPGRGRGSFTAAPSGC